MKKEEFLTRFKNMMDEIEENNIEYDILDLVILTNKPIKETILSIDEIENIENEN